jgi:hypothetical protein
MRTVITSFLAVGLIGAATAAEAKCTRLGFSVNDYGKIGPTKDAKDLLDKQVAKWAADNGVKKYAMGKKDVTCELYLDLIVFDEYTCRAEASVCWDGAGAAPKQPTVADGSAIPKSAAPRAVPAAKAPAAVPTAPKAKSAPGE